MKTLAENAVQLDEEARMARLTTSSNYSISKLSLASQTKRHSKLKKEKAHYLKLAHDISKSTGMDTSALIAHFVIIDSYTQVLPLTMTRQTSCQASSLQLRAVTLEVQSYKTYTRKRKRVVREEEKF